MNQMNRLVGYSKFDPATLKNLGTKINRFNALKPPESNFLHNIPFEAFAFIIAYTFVFLLGFFTNIKVIFLYMFNKNLKKYKNYYFVNLSVSSLIILFQCVPISITDLITKGEWEFGPVYCNNFFLFNFL